MSERPTYYLLRDRIAYPVEDLIAWARGCAVQRRGADGDVGSWRVARTEVGGTTISTVFLGIDHACGDVPPLLFETMDMTTNDCERSSTWADAEAMHARWVEEARKREGVRP